MDYRTKKTKVKKTVIVGNADTKLLDANKIMDDYHRHIQNLGDGDIYVSYGTGSATEGSNGERLLKPADHIDTAYQGEIRAIAKSGSSASASVLTL